MQEALPLFVKDEVIIYEDYEHIYCPYDANYTGLEGADVI
jgi:hypothetical protein